MNSDTVTIGLEITGRVQGVGFRESLRAVAQALGVTGWVRNRADGSVQAIVQGAPDDVEQVVAWCHNGPPGALVRYVETTAVERVEHYTGFTRRPLT